MKKHPKASSLDITNLENWHWNHNGAIATEEQTYLTNKSDLIRVVPKETGPLRKLLERTEWFRTHRIWKNKEAPELPIYDKDLITYASDKAINKFITILIVSVGMIMLITPLWVLQTLQDSRQKLGAITAFVVAFLGMVSYATTARPFETLGATAA